MGSSDITAAPAWQALSRHHEQIRGADLRQLFAEDPDRGAELTLTVGDLYIDYSKHRVTRETLSLLLDLARAAAFEPFHGEQAVILSAEDDDVVMDRKAR